jgi:hypothetical protein
MVQVLVAYTACIVVLFQTGLAFLALRKNHRREFRRLGWSGVLFLLVMIGFSAGWSTLFLWIIVPLGQGEVLCFVGLLLLTVFGSRVALSGSRRSCVALRC